MNFVHRPMPEGGSASNPVIIRRILDPLASDDPNLAREGIELARWFLTNVQVPRGTPGNPGVREQIQDGIDVARTRHQLPNYAKGRTPIEYSWSNFVAPACDDCNNAYSEMEGRIKPIVEALGRREALPVSAYIELLDWLDKVRIGVWLLRHQIEKYPIEITPNFHIETRIGKKDRMLAVYAFDGQSKGINLFGADSLIFNEMPSCFGLRANDTLLLNVSADFFCSKGCGLPYPDTMTLQIGGPDGGRLMLQDFKYPKIVSNPVTKLKLYKPVVWLYQPIKLPSLDPTFQGGFVGHTNTFDSRTAALTLEGNDRLGALFRQDLDGVRIYRRLSDMIEFDEVTGDDCAMQKDIAASVYDCQIRLFKAVNRRWIDRSRKNRVEKALRQLKLDNAAEMARLFRNGTLGRSRPNEDAAGK
ncbi:hypothetical protein GA0061099_10316 [Bradyrhizobium yuanmingense]|uniref:Uncharacterized protein n=2 Tax=Bradyrhizobium yuanmingense TaxID=108015 RepID=A0A1C3XJA2_9BRAD|nr:hypothetical protein IQ15_07416 [Bradyrhizobium yuanmingense]SCB52340.1 hypothetical protein GA0061099_10316 [Bradyrhizobium yuanmingense]